jgi:hypothetical protein
LFDGFWKTTPTGFSHCVATTCASIPNKFARQSA